MPVNTIWKFPLRLTDEQVIVTPSNFKPLSVQFQNNVLCLWAYVYTEPNGLKSGEAKIRIVGTGGNFPAYAKYKFIGTVQDPEGLVWHVFWR